MRLSNKLVALCALVLLVGIGYGQLQIQQGTVGVPSVVDLSVQTSKLQLNSYFVNMLSNTIATNVTNTAGGSYTGTQSFTFTNGTTTLGTMYYTLTFTPSQETVVAAYTGWTFQLSNLQPGTAHIKIQIA